MMIELMGEMGGELVSRSMVDRCNSLLDGRRRLHLAPDTTIEGARRQFFEAYHYAYEILPAIHAWSLDVISRIQQDESEKKMALFYLRDAFPAYIITRVLLRDIVVPNLRIKPLSLSLRNRHKPLVEEYLRETIGCNPGTIYHVDVGSRGTLIGVVHDITHRWQGEKIAHKAELFEHDQSSPVLKKRGIETHFVMSDIFPVHFLINGITSIHGPAINFKYRQIPSQTLRERLAGANNRSRKNNLLVCPVFEQDNIMNLNIFLRHACRVAVHDYVDRIKSGKVDHNLGTAKGVLEQQLSNIYTLLRNGDIKAKTLAYLLDGTGVVYDFIDYMKNKSEKTPKRVL